jgi:acyl carrier protein
MPIAQNDPASMKSLGDVATVIEVFRLLLDPDGDIAADTDFFEAGGNSILAARAVARLRQSFDTEVSMRDVLFGRTPRLLAEGLACETVSERQYFKQSSAKQSLPSSREGLDAE